MIPLKDTPTRLIDPATRPKVVIHPVRPPSRFRGWEDAWTLTRLLIRLTWLRLRRRHSAGLAGRELRAAFESLGGLWIKAGQLLALRIDLFPVEFCQELAHLQHTAIGFPADVAHRIVEEELGAQIASNFDEFGAGPFAVASIGQVFRAHLRHEDAWVAVKVQRPNIDVLFQRDFSVIRRVIWMLEVLGVYPHMRWRIGLQELRAVMDEEIDYFYEASNMRRMRKLLKPHKIFVPKVFSKYCTRRVLVTEFVHGVLMADVIKSKQTNRARLDEWLQENNIDPRRVAQRLMRSLFRQMLEDNLYHGDLHPGNIVLLSNSRVALIDFGTTSFTEKEYLERFRLFVHALAIRDYSKAADLCFLMSPRLPHIDLDDVKEKLVQVLRTWTRRTQVPELPYQQKSLENVTVGLVRVLHEHKCATEWAFLRFHRAFTTLDMSLIHLHPDANYPRMLQRYFKQAELRTVRQMFTTEMTLKSIGAYRTALEIQDRLAEYTMFQGKLVRRHAQLFEGATDKFAAFMSSIVVTLAFLVAVAEGIAFLLFMGQYRPVFARYLLGEAFVGFAGRAPALDPTMWLLVLAVVGYVALRLLRTARVLRQKDLNVSQRVASV